MVYINRIIKITKNNSFFLFGARGTGKSTFLKETFQNEDTLYVDLLKKENEQRYLERPDTLYDELIILVNKIKFVIIDEVQKVPGLLDLVHKLIEETNLIFILTGSSARKLKYGGANLLAGRAFNYHMFPLSIFEIPNDKQNLIELLRFGSLPMIICKHKTVEDKINYLKAYSDNYIKEEVWLEQYIRKLEPFRKFLNVASQCNGKIINYSNIARNVKVDNKTIKEYFTILEDTLIGFMLEAYNSSFRKRLSTKPKFYFFDTGVTRSLSKQLTANLHESTSAFGEIFEHMIILEAIKLAKIYYVEYNFSYLKTKDNAEIDLVIERPGEKTLLIEIKSSENVSKEQLNKFAILANDVPNSEAVCFSRDLRKKITNNITVYPWKEGLKEFFIPSQ